MKNNPMMLASRPEFRQDAFGELGGLCCARCAELNPLQARYCMQCGSPMRPVYAHRSPHNPGLLRLVTGSNRSNALLALGCLKDAVIVVIFLSLLTISGVNLDWDTLDDRILICAVLFVLVVMVSVFAKLIYHSGGDRS